MPNAFGYYKVIFNVWDFLIFRQSGTIIESFQIFYFLFKFLFGSINIDVWKRNEFKRYISRKTLSRVNIVFSG